MIGKDNYIGQQIGNYEVVNKLGSGSFGTVYLARNKHVTAHLVAIKLMNATYVSSQQERDNFLQEASLLVKLKYPHILPILDFGIVDTSMPYMVTEYAINGSLRDRIQRQLPDLLPLLEVLSMLSQVGQALHYAHQHNIVHRDLKPENILFNAQEEVLLADFGIATELSTSTIRNAATIIGTPSYMAPEQFEGTVSKLSDQYALGCIAYELVTGRRPFTAPNFAAMGKKHIEEVPVPPRQLNPQLPEHVEQTILQAMAKERTKRHTNVGAFTIALGTVPLVTPSPPSPPAVTTATLKGTSDQIELGATELTIGRAPNNQHVLTDTQVSKYHAVIRPEGSGYTITDLKSTNHTFVNEQQLSSHVPHSLKHGDTIRIGTTKFSYEENQTPPISKTVWVEPPKPTPLPSTPLPPVQKTPPRSGGIVAVICIVGILLLIGVIAIPAVIRSNQIAADNATATTQAINNETATATAHQNLYNTATSGTPALSDPLSDNSNNNRWAINSQCQFTGGAYHASITQQGYLGYCPAYSTSFSNFAYQVQMTIVQGNIGGIMFHLSQVNGNAAYYYFYIGQAGSYGFAIGGGGHYTIRQTGSSSAINTGLNQTNLIAVVAQGAELNLYVNKQFIFSVNDTNYSQGEIGVGALDNTHSTEVAFSNAQVWRL